MKTAWMILGLYITFSISSIADAKMAAPQSITIESILNHYNALKKQRPFTPAESDIINLLTVVQNAFELETLSTYSASPSTVTINDLNGNIRNQILEDPSWSRKLTPEKFRILQDHKDFLKNKFGAQSYEWAWVLNQMGDHAGAKKILMVNFDETFRKAKGHMTYGPGNHLRVLDSIYKILKNSCTPDEKSSFEKKILEVKKQYSNSPNILT